jgi:hypothetical protein
MKPGRQHQIAAVGQKAVIGAVLVHDRNTLDPVSGRAGLGDIGDLAVEIALLASHPRIDRISNSMGDFAP